MSNSNVLIEPFKGGLLWVKSEFGNGLGAPPIVEKVVATAYGTGLFKGDLLKVVNDGTVAVAAAGEAPAYVMLSAKQYVGDDSLVRKGAYLPASRSYTGSAAPNNPLASVVLCIPVTGQIFEISQDEATTSWATAQAMVGEMFDMVASAAGSTITGQSGYKLDTSTGGGVVSGQFIAVEVPRYGLYGGANNPAAANWRIWVKANPSEIVTAI